MRSVAACAIRRTSPECTAIRARGHDLGADPDRPDPGTAPADVESALHGGKSPGGLDGGGIREAGADDVVFVAAAHLTEGRIKSLRSRRTTHDSRDAHPEGFGVRVCHRHSQHDGQRTWKIVGDTAGISLAEARQRAWAMLPQSEAALLLHPTGPVRGARRRGLSSVWAHMRAPHAQGRPGLLPRPDPALVQGTADRRDHAQRRPAVVCVPACNAGRGRTAGAGHLVHRGPGGRLWTPACRKQFISRPEPRSLTRPLQMVGEAVLRPEAAMILLLREGIDAIGPPFARETTNLNLVFAA